MTDDRRLPLAEFRPRSQLRVEAHEVVRPRFPLIDIHNHLGSPFGGDWPSRTSAELAGVLDASEVEMFVDLDGGHGDQVSMEIDRWALGGRVAVFCGLDYDMWATEPRFGDVEAGRLRDSVARGARGLKVWKPLGLRARDGSGRLVGVDDARLDPVFQVAAEVMVPVLIHVGDPFAFFEPLEPTNERYEELHDHPDWHFWPTRVDDSVDGQGFPTVRSILLAFDRLVGRHRQTTFIGAHVAGSSEDLAFVDGLLERHPNLSVDIAERIGELGRQPYTARAFFLRWANRICFGLDQPADPRAYGLYYRFLETFDESFDYGIGETPRQGRWQIHGLGLPDDVLRKVYRDNAKRILQEPR